MPQFYSTDTKTAYTPIGSTPMGLDDATQLAIQQGQTNTRAYIPQAVQFDLRERRDIGNINARVTPTRAIDFTSSFTTTRHSGELPWGASFGFSNDVEVPLPYDSRTNDFSLGAEWSNDRGMVRVAYDGSWFDNLDDTLVWDSPLRLTDIAGGPGRGQMALWPSNTAQTVSAAGYAKFAHRTQVTGFLSIGSRSNNEPLLPFTINPAVVPQLTLPRANTDGEAQIFSGNVGLVSRPTRDWRFSARLRRYDYNNDTPQAVIPQFVNYDTSVTESTTNGPQLFAHDRTTFDADATWSGLQPLAITAGYTLNSNGYAHRTFESSDEQVFTLKADAVGNQWMTFRAHYEHANRTGDGLDEAELVQLGEQPKMRHYDIADRNRDKFTGQVDISPTELVTVSVSAGLGNDDYPDSYFGLQEASFRVFTTSIDWEPVAGYVVGGSYSYEKYNGLQTSRTASPGQTPDQVTDPRRDWSADSTEKVNYFSLYVTPPRFGNTEARLSYDYARSEGRFVYGLAPDTTLPTPSPLPEVFNKLQQFRVEVRHRLSSRLRATLSYLYEPFDVYDFAFDPDGNRQHHPAELDGTRLRLSSVYGPLGRRRPGLRVVVLPPERSSSPGGPMTRTVSTLTSTLAGATLAFTLGAASRVGSRRRADQAGRGGLRRAEMPDVPRHRRQGQQDQPPRRRRDQVVGRGYQGVDRHARGDDGQDQVDQEAADAGQVRRAAGSRPRRARGLPPEPEVAAGRGL